MLNSPDENTQILDSVKDFYSLQDKILTSSATATSNPTKKVEYEYTINDLYSKTVASRPVAEFCKIYKGDKVTMLSNGEVMSGWEDRIDGDMHGVFTLTDPIVSPYTYQTMADVSDGKVIIANANYYKILTMDFDTETISVSSEYETGYGSETQVLKIQRIKDNTLIFFTENETSIIEVQNDNSLVVMKTFAESIGINSSLQPLFEFEQYKKWATIGISEGTLYIDVAEVKDTLEIDIIKNTSSIPCYASSSSIGFCLYDDTHFIINYPYSSSVGYYVICKINSNNTVTFGSAYEIFPGESIYQGSIRFIKLDNYIAVIYKYNIGGITYARKVTVVDDATLSIGTENNITTYSDGNISPYVAYTGDKFILIPSRYSSGYNVYKEIFEVASDGTITQLSSELIDTVSIASSFNQRSIQFWNDSSNRIVISAFYEHSTLPDTYYNYIYNYINQANNIIGSARNTADGDLDESCEIIIDGLDDTNLGLVVNTDYYVNRDGSLTTDDTDGVYFGRAVSSTKIAFQSRMKTNTLDIRTEAAVATEIDETKFSHKLPIKINGVQYYVMLTQA